MEQLELVLESIKHWVWSAPLLILLIGTGIYLTVILRGLQITHLGYAIREVIATQRVGSKGDITAFEALMTTLAGAIGTGTIVGVTTGIMIGGLGSIFWMWVTAFVGMATKFAEGLLAVKYRVTDKKGEMVGGPMEYIQRGLGWRWLAILFAIFGVGACIGTGNLVQVNSIADAIGNVWDVNPWYTGIVLSALTGLILIGGVKSIGRVAAILVPFMALFYFFGGLWVIIANYEQLPTVLKAIFVGAFSNEAAVGGFIGSSVMMAIQMGVSRGVFTTEAGLGISSIAAAAAQTDSPVRQAFVNMTGPLIVVLVCTMSGLVIAVTGVMGLADADGNLLTGASLAIEAFASSLYGGRYAVIIGLVLFAYTTVIAWAYYGEKCCEFLFGERSIKPFRVLFTLAVIPGAAINLKMAWILADTLNGLMVIPNLIAIIALSGVIVSETRKFLNSESMRAE